MNRTPSWEFDSSEKGDFETGAEVEGGPTGGITGKRRHERQQTALADPL
ncbi:hypothetical protein [Persicitalea jodogahamensis]|nr:hypothetical protein [Persicitalea jodogahamensis]